LYLLDIVVRDFHASELVLNRQHQLNAIEQVGTEIVGEVRLTRDRLNVNAELFCNESANIVDAKPFVQRRWPLKRCQATDCHDEAPESVRASNNVQINVPGTVTLFQKFWSVA
jgi:hypothetical protein